MRSGFSVFLITAAVIAAGGCSRNSGSDPAAANLAPADENAPPAAQQPYQPAEEQPYQPAAAEEQLAVAPQPPPPLPQYQQPPCPGQNYIWTPGYWAYSAAGYYWVPGVWVMAPYVDALWTPPYWAFYDGSYRWHAGYWGRYIGFYGGINYGFGYTGLGFYGGYWSGGDFVYNRAVTDININLVHRVYDRSVVNYTPFNHIDYNGGPHGIRRDPAPAELAARNGTHFGAVPAQIEHARQAAATRGQFMSENHGRPAAAALTRPLATQYRAPAAAPQTWQRAAARPEPANVQRQPEGRPPVQTRGEASRAERPEVRPVQPPASVERRAPVEFRRAAPVQGRVEPQAHPAMPQRAEVHPAPQAHAAPQSHFAAPERAPQRPPQRTLQAHAAPRRAEVHPAPQAHAAARPQPAHPEPHRGGPPEEHKK